MTITALVIDKMGRINTQKLFYILSGVTVFVMGCGIPVNALLAVSLIGRMSIMAASVSVLFTLVLCGVVFLTERKLLCLCRTPLGCRRLNCSTQTREQWVTPVLLRGAS